MSFADEMQAFVEKAMTRRRQIYEGVVDACDDSLVRGSAITGSPGQPEDLRNGAFSRRTIDEWTTEIATEDPSAQSVEDGISHLHGNPITLNTPVGGFHSKALTEAGFDRIVEDVARRVVGSDA